MCCRRRRWQARSVLHRTRWGWGWGARGGGWGRAGMAISMLVTLNGTIMSGARVPFATARDGYFFKAIAEVHPRFHTPWVAIVVQCGLAIVLLLLGGSFRQFFSLDRKSTR